MRMIEYEDLYIEFQIASVIQPQINIVKDATQNGNWKALVIELLS